ncbi:MAG: HU family DNA-binding protein [Candidatus Eremiobacteraeota bacterium]|nr:HU family DNA-binding protein [Candidatus Eremiobacteraeota bacterium]
MNKVDLVRSAMERLDLARKDAVALVDGLFEDIQDAVMAGEAVKIPGFGQFKVRDRAARMGRNPATGETIKIAAKRVFKFLPAKALKDAIMSKRRGAASGGGGRKSGGKGSKAAAGRKGGAKKTASKAPARKGGAKKSSGRKKR